MKKGLKVALWLLGLPLVLVTLTATGYAAYTLTAFDREMPAVWEAGFVEKQVRINGSVINYAEGPDHGPALLLIHGQGMDWKDYRKVLPTLARQFHVYAVDCYGHGNSAQVPEKYRVSAIGPDLKSFVGQVIAKPTIVSGHSSGGIVAAWLASNASENVRGAVLEDPPLLTTLFPRAYRTWNYHDLATTTHNFLRSGATDFVVYNMEHSPMFKLFGDLQNIMITDARRQRQRHPDRPVKFAYMPPIMNELLRAMNTYDPRFGDAFYTGSWDQGFDQEATLRSISIPTVLIHTKTVYDDQGYLRAAMDDQDARRAASMIKNVKFVEVDTGHGFHDEQPRQFIDLLTTFRAIAR